MLLPVMLYLDCYCAVAVCEVIFKLWCQWCSIVVVGAVSGCLSTVVMVLLVRLYLNCAGADAGQVVVKLWWCSLYNGKYPPPPWGGRGIYNGKYPPGGGGEISANVILGKKYEKWKRKRGKVEEKKRENGKEKGRKGKEKGRRGKE